MQLMYGIRDPMSDCGGYFWVNVLLTCQFAAPPYLLPPFYLLLSAQALWGMGCWGGGWFRHQELWLIADRFRGRFALPAAGGRADHQLFSAVNIGQGGGVPMWGACGGPIDVCHEKLHGAEQNRTLLQKNRRQERMVRELPGCKHTKLPTYLYLTLAPAMNVCSSTQNQLQMYHGV